jgi:hypothetical protein
MVMFALVNTVDGRVMVIHDQEGPTPPDHQWIAYGLSPTLVPAQLIYNGTELVLRELPPPPTPVAPTRWPVLKTTIRHRLRDLGMETISDAARATLPQADQHEWEDAIVIASDDPRIIAFLNAIGVDPASVLALDRNASMFRSFI